MRLFPRGNLSFINNRFVLTYQSRKSSSNTSRINEETVGEITAILRNRNWPHLLNSSPNLLKSLNPDVIQSVLHQNQRADPNRLLHFFNWSIHQIGTLQNLKSFLILAAVLCNSNQSRHASILLGQMIETRKPVSDIMESIASFCVEGEGLNSGSSLYGMIIDAYNNKRMFDEAVSVVSGINNRNHFPDSSCVNSMMTNLSKYHKKELAWKVYDKMLELHIVPDVYIYTNLISALCKNGNMSEAKRVFVEMGEKGCDPSLVTYNVLIGGLCRAGLFDEAFELKTSMTDKGLVPDQYTYTTLIDGLSKAKRLEEAKMVLEDMSKVGTYPDHVAYSALIDGFMKQGCVDEALKLKDEMFVNGVKLNVFTYNSIISGLCKAHRFEEAIGILTGMKERGTPPDVYCYNSLIIGLCKKKRWKKCSQC